jgi:Flp pilus assembly pilin Flp
MSIFVKKKTFFTQFKGVKLVVFGKNSLLFGEKGIWVNEEGATAIEYGLILASVGIVIIIGLSQLGASTNALMQLAIEAFETAAPTT